MTEAEAAAEAARVAKNAAIQEGLDATAADAAKASLDPKAKVPDGHVRVRITKPGHGKVHTGGPPRRSVRDTGAEVYEGEKLAPTYAQGDRPILQRKIAEELEARHFAEIET